MSGFSRRFLIVFTLSLFFYSGLFASTISRPMSNSGLVGYWDFESGKGDATAYDKSGRGNNGILTSMNNNSSWTSSSSTGQALNFDGSDDWININDAPSVDIYPSITMVAWFKTNTVSGLRSIVTKGSSGQAFNYGFGLSGTGIYSRHHSGDNTSNAVVVTTGVWHQLAIVNNGSRDYFYYDGVLVDSVAYTSNGTNDLPLTIGSTCVGASCTSRADKFNGLLDEVRLYNRVLSSDEISRLYKIQKPKVASGINNTGLVGYWPLDEGSGTRVEDMSFSSNNGTVGGNAPWVTGRVGKALSFDGGSQYVSTGFAQQMNDFTVCVWFKSTGVTSYDRIIDKSYSGGFWIGRNGTNANSWGGGVEEGTDPFGIFVTLPDGVWHHICSIRSGTIHKIIGDGGLVSNSNTVSSSALSGHSVFIGSETGGGSFFTGYIDDVRIYNRALSDIEVYNLYKGSKSAVINKSKTDRLTNGLVGYWTFDGNKIAGVMAYDSSTNGNNGTMLGGPTPTLGKIGQALLFDGVGSYVDIPNFDTSVDMSISLWFKANIAITEDGFHTLVEGDDDNPWFGVHTISNVPRVEFYDNNPRTSGILPNTWYHVVYTSDTENNIGVIYVNGVASTTGSSNQGSPTTGLGIGRHSGDIAFPGVIDDVRIYNRPLSYDEVNVLYNMGR